MPLAGVNRPSYRPQSISKKAIGSVTPGGYFNHFPMIAAAFPEVLSEIVVETAGDVVDKAAGRVPVLTGKLRDSARTRLYRRASDGNVISARIDWMAKNEEGAPYGFFVEVGTVDTPAHPFVVPTIQEERGEFVGKLQGLEARLPR